MSDNLETVDGTVLAVLECLSLVQPRVVWTLPVAALFVRALNKRGIELVEKRP